MALSRRSFFNHLGAAGSLAAATGVAGLSASTGGGTRASISGSVWKPPFSAHAAPHSALPAGNMNLNVTAVETVWVNLPMRPVPARRMFAENYEWTYFQIHKVKLACGVVGFGETMPFYTWGRPTEETIAYAKGRNAAELMWNDQLGAGLQMALFDAVAKASDVPLYRLLGSKHRDRAFISWWDLDMAGDDWVLECREALAHGYTAFKTKARPWRSLVEDCQTLCKILPPYFSLDVDFNDLLLDVSHATETMQELALLPNVAAFETPIPQGDVAGNRFLRSQTRVPIAMHYGNPPVMTALKEEVCDVFVVGGGASAVMQTGAVAAMANRPFWLQLVGTGVTAAFAIQLAAVLSHATWPSVNCHQLYVNPLIKPAIAVENGSTAIPERPGLGFDLDEDAIAKYRIEPLARQPDPPEALMVVRWPTGAAAYFATKDQYWDDFRSGRYAPFVKGVRYEYIPNNGSREWKELHDRAKKGGVFSKERVL